VVAALRSMQLRDGRGELLEAGGIVNVAMVEGGVAHNLVPERCKLVVDIRFPPEQTADDVLRDVRAAVAQTLGDDSELPSLIEPEATCVRNPRSSLRLPEDHPLARRLCDAHIEATGRPARIGFHPAWPDTPILNEAGIPAVTYGPGSMECYWDDEWVSVQDYLAAVRTYCLAATQRPGE